MAAGCKLWTGVDWWIDGCRRHLWTVTLVNSSNTYVTLVNCKMQRPTPSYKESLPFINPSKCHIDAVEARDICVRRYLETCSYQLFKSLTGHCNVVHNTGLDHTIITHPQSTVKVSCIVSA